MKTSKHLLHCLTWVALLSFAACVLPTPHAVAQTSTPIGPSVDECTGGTVDPYGYVVETVCLLGDSTELYTTNEVNSNNSDYIPQVDSDTILADSDNTIDSDSGYAVMDLGEEGGTEAYTGNSTVPILNDVYTVYGNFGYCYDESGQGGTGGGDGTDNDCNWSYPNTYLSTQGVVTLTGSQGLVYPKYIVTGVTYAPPGSGSDVQYTGTTSVGNSSTNSSSFSNALGYTIQVEDKIGIPKGQTGATGGVTLTVSQSTDYTEAQNNSATLTFNKSTSIGNTTDGYPTTNSPNGPPSPALPHDYDLIWLWLNPELVYTAYPAAGNSAGFVEWSGYAYDPTDENGPDIFPVQVGCLNGDFSPSECSTEQGVLNRAWVQNEKSPTSGTAVTASGCPNTAESPSICPNTQDAYDILAADPLAYNPGGSAYAGFNASPLPTTTPDGRYTQFSSTYNPVYYVPGSGPSVSITQMDTEQQSNGGSSQIQAKIEVSEMVSAGFLGIFGQKSTYTESDTVTQTNSWLDTLSQQQTIQNAYKIVGSSPPNYVDGEFILYQDNQNGTFVFVPWQ